MKYVNLFLLLLVFSVNALADVPMIKPTPQPKSVEMRMTITFSKQTNKPILIIPKSALKDLRAQIEEMDEENDASSASASVNSSRFQTIASGLFLSLGIVFGGVLFARSRKSALPPNKKIAAGLMLFLVASMTTVVFANVGPPAVLRSISSRLFDKKVFGGSWRRAYGNVRLELAGENKSSEIQLVIPDAGEEKPTSEE